MNPIRKYLPLNYPTEKGGKFDGEAIVYLGTIMLSYEFHLVFL